MKNHTPLFPNFHFQTLRRKPRSAQQILAEKVAQLKEKSLSQLGECFGKFVPKKYLNPTKSGALSRRRWFSRENTFWAFFSQILDADGGCQEVVRKLQAFAAMKSQALPSSSTSAYCQARKKLDLSSLESILRHTSKQLKSKAEPSKLNGRRVIVVDGTGVSMPDTAENQHVWPQQSRQKPGCSFPQASICACFSLQTGALLSYEIGNKKSHELPMLRKQWSTFKSGDIFLGDKIFCSYYDISKFKEMGVDSVLTLARRHPVTKAEAVKVFGKDDLLIHWKKPSRSKASSYSQKDWEELPEKLLLRQIKVTVKEPGFRVTSFYIIATLLNAKKYPADEIADLYLQRWDVELFFRDIKTTMGMDILRCKTPDMVRKEIMMHFIVYNSIRCLMLEAANRKDVKAQRISFKGSVQSLRQWEPHLNLDKISRQERDRLIEQLYESIAGNIVPERPGRREPRALKRRRKNFALLTSPRHEMVDIPHRAKYRAEGA
ncbi:MAG: IS4 family transposase [Deltaproteobacteria bacterium]|nr:IS4 family transposase [Deltaproteobacteria bacterium]